MNLILLLFSILATYTTVSSRWICDACFDDICYTKSSIIKHQPVSGQIAVDRKENVVYYHYVDQEPNNQTVAFDLDDVRNFSIPDIKFSFAITVDQNTREVYIGGEYGIYKYDPVAKNTTLYGLNDKTIWHMHFKDVLYYTVHNMKGLYTTSDDITALRDFHIDDFIVDKRNDIYFMSNFTIYKLKNGDKEPTVFSNIIYSLATDIFDNAYFVQQEIRGLYKIDYRNGRIIKVGAFGGGSPYRFVFSRFNSLIYYDADTSKLYHLTPNYGKCEVKDPGVGRPFNITENVKVW